MEMFIAQALTGIIIYQNLHIRELTSDVIRLTKELSNNQLKNYAASTLNPNDDLVQANKRGREFRQSLGMNVNGK